VGEGGEKVRKKGDIDAKGQVAEWKDKTVQTLLWVGCRRKKK